MASYRGHSDDDNPEVQGNSPPAGQRQRDNIGMVVLLVLVILVDTVLQVLMLHMEFYYY